MNPRTFLLALAIISCPIVGSFAAPNEPLQACRLSQGHDGVAICTKVIESGIYDGSFLGEAYGNRGVRYQEVGDCARALPDLEKALSLIGPENMGNASTYYIRAKCRLAAGQREEAKKDLRKALSLDNREMFAKALRELDEKPPPTETATKEKPWDQLSTAEKRARVELDWQVKKAPGTEFYCPDWRYINGWEFKFKPGHGVVGGYASAKQLVDGFDTYLWVQFSYRPTRQPDDPTTPKVEIYFATYKRLPTPVNATVTLREGNATIISEMITLRRSSDNRFEEVLSDAFLREVTKHTTNATVEVLISSIPAPYVVTLNRDHLADALRELQAPYNVAARLAEGKCSKMMGGGGGGRFIFR